MFFVSTSCKACSVSGLEVNSADGIAFSWATRVKTILMMSEMDKPKLAKTVLASSFISLFMRAWTIWFCDMAFSPFVFVCMLYVIHINTFVNKFFVHGETLIMLTQKTRRAYVRILYKNKEPEKEKTTAKIPATWE